MHKRGLKLVQVELNGIRWQRLSLRENLKIMTLERISSLRALQEEVWRIL
jgi:hypothetical protein